MKQQFLLQCNTQRGFAGFSLYPIDPPQDTTGLGLQAGGDLSGFTTQITDPNGNTYTVTVSRP